MDSTPEIELIPDMDLYEVCDRMEEFPSVTRARIRKISKHLKEISGRTDLDWEDFNEKTKDIARQINSIGWLEISERLRETDRKLEAAIYELAAATLNLSEEDPDSEAAKPVLARYKKVVSVYLLKHGINECLNIISKALSKTSCQRQRLFDSIFHLILILFGMCSSRPCYIYAAIFGSSSTRVFS